MLTTISAGRVFDFSHCIGMYRQDGQGFFNPSDFAIGSGGTLYVVNRGNLNEWARITKLNLDHEYLGDIGKMGYGDNEFIFPSSIALDRDENVYVDDDFLHRISVFDKEGNFLHKWGTQGSGDGELDAPAGLTFDSEDNLLVVDAKNSRIQKFDKQGNYLGKWGTHGSADGQLDMPWGIHLDRDGHVFIADWGNRRVQKFTSDGQFLTSYGAPGSGPGTLDRPSSVSVDSEGDIYVTDWNANKLHIYAPEGRFIAGLTGGAVEPSPWAITWLSGNPSERKARRQANLQEEWLFRRPVAVRNDANDGIFILEQWRMRFQVYNKVKDYQGFDLNI